MPEFRNIWQPCRHCCRVRPARAGRKSSRCSIPGGHRSQSPSQDQIRQDTSGDNEEDADGSGYAVPATIDGSGKFSGKLPKRLRPLATPGASKRNRAEAEAPVFRMAACCLSPTAMFIDALQSACFGTLPLPYHYPAAKAGRKFAASGESWNTGNCLI